MGVRPTWRPTPLARLGERGSDTHRADRLAGPQCPCPAPGPWRIRGATPPNTAARPHRPRSLGGPSLARPPLLIRGTLVDWSHTFLGITLKTVPRRKDQDGFAVLAKRWRVERSISWITGARRHVRDYERLVSHSEAHITWTFITLMVRRLTRPPRPPRTPPHPVEPVEASANTSGVVPAPLLGDPVVHGLDECARRRAALGLTVFPGSGLPLSRRGSRLCCIRGRHRPPLPGTRPSRPSSSSTGLGRCPP